MHCRFHVCQNVHESAANLTNHRINKGQTDCMPLPCIFQSVNDNYTFFCECRPTVPPDCKVSVRNKSYLLIEGPHVGIGGYCGYRSTCGYWLFSFSLDLRTLYSSTVPHIERQTHTDMVTRVIYRDIVVHTACVHVAHKTNSQRQSRRAESSTVGPR